jgi:hypothetical protein
MHKALLEGMLLKYCTSEPNKRLLNLSGKKKETDQHSGRIT